MCAKLPCAPTTSLNGNDRVDYTQEKANLQKRKVNVTKIRKVHADGNKLRKEWRPNAQ